jgi:Fe-S-cluster-containing hydrogenase component 2
MTAPVYHRLREQLNQYSVGYPTTASGVEIKILERLFTEEQAALFLDMSMMLESSAAVAGRTGRDPKTTARMLAQMAEKGLVFRKKAAGQNHYAAVAFVIGSYEFQLKNMDRDFAEMMEAYFEQGLLDFSPGKNILPLRTIPVQQSIPVNHPVARYAQAREIIASQKTIAVSDCICRLQQKLIDKGCDKPKEVCLSFGSHAEYYVENKMGRFISREEALAILDEAEKAGLVNQPANMVNPGGMCNCCGDCCGVLRTLARQPKPAASVYNDFRAQVSPEVCTACEVCLERCQIDAIEIRDQTAVINKDRCIGCGLCVTTCPPGAIEMVLKPEDERIKLPSNGRKLMVRTAKLRGTSLIPRSMTEDRGGGVPGTD